MTDHMTAAMEAGVQELLDEGLLDQEGYDGYREEVARRTLNAMLPHLRKMIAQEIMAYLDDFPRHGLIYRDGVWAGVHSAAQIAKGAQQ